MQYGICYSNIQYVLLRRFYKKNLLIIENLNVNDLIENNKPIVCQVPERTTARSTASRRPWASTTSPRFRTASTALKTGWLSSGNEEFILGKG